MMPAWLRRPEIRVVIAMSMAVVSLLVGACAGPGPDRDVSITHLPEVNKIVVAGFSPALSPGDPSDWATDPITGAVFWAEPVPEGVAVEMTDILFDKMVEVYGYSLVSPGQARGAFSEILASDRGLKLDALAMVREIGKAFGADGVLVGRIYRWQEREGTDYAISRPASVAFNLLLVRPADGAILWRGRFDKTQQSLSENLFDMSTFLHGGGRWMTARKLALMGLDGTMARMPKGKGAVPPQQRQATQPEEKL
jgi:hypothetical protein